MRSNAAIGLVFKNQKQEVLLVKRKDVPVWVLPGGGIDDQETAELAVVREVLEETGLKVMIIKKVASYTPINRLAKKTETFECQPVEGNLTLTDETQNIRYFLVNQLPKDLLSIHKVWIEEALLNNNQVIERPLYEVSYLNFALFFIKHPLIVLKFLYTLISKN